VRASVHSRGLSVLPLGAAAIAALLLLGLTSSFVAGASVYAPKCDYTRLRTGPGTSYAIQTSSLMTTSRVTVVATVAGGSYATSCGTASISGSQWLRVTAIDGHSVSTLYGRTYLYGASGLFKLVSTTAATASPTMSPSTSSSPSVAPSGPASS
jgi:hypothetical protein